MTVAESGGTLVEVWDWIITCQSTGGPPRPKMTHCSWGTHLLRRSRSPDPHLSLPPALTLPISQLFVILPASAPSELVPWVSFIYQSVRAHIRAHIHAHISRISLKFSFGRELTLSQPLRWSCSLSSPLFSCLSMTWSAFPSNSVIDIRNRGTTRNWSGSHVSLESLEGPASLLLPILRPVAPLIWLSHLL